MLIFGYGISLDVEKIQKTRAFAAVINTPERSTAASS
jgi:hypothetical protein